MSARQEPQSAPQDALWTALDRLQQAERALRQAASERGVIAGGAVAADLAADLADEAQGMVGAVRALLAGLHG